MDRVYAVEEAHAFGDGLPSLKTIAAPEIKTQPPTNAAQAGIIGRKKAASQQIQPTARSAILMGAYRLVVGYFDFGFAFGHRVRSLEG
jgi:hypothetical protein